MSAFSRGILLRPQCAPKQFVHLMGCTRAHQYQLFSSSSVLRAVKKVRSSTPLKALPNKPSFSPTKSTAKPTFTLGEFQSFESVLAKRSRPTILYQAPSHTGFMVACYMAGGFCLLYSAFTFNFNYMGAPPDMSAWMPIAFGGVSLILCCAGTYLLLGPAGIVNTITAIPRSSSNVSGASSSSLAKAAQSELQIEVELKKVFPVPFLPARKLYVNPGEIVLPAPLSPGVNGRLIKSVNEARAQRLEEEAARQKALEYEQSHVMSRGVRHTMRAFSQACYSFFQGTRRAVYREGFVKIGVKDRKYKLDLSGGWVLDEGRALDRLSVIKRRV